MFAFQIELRQSRSSPLTKVPLLFEKRTYSTFRRMKWTKTFRGSKQERFTKKRISFYFEVLYIRGRISFTEDPCRASLLSFHRKWISFLRSLWFCVSSFTLLLKMKTEPTDKAPSFSQWIMIMMTFHEKTKESLTSCCSWCDSWWGNEMPTLMTFECNGANDFRVESAVSWGSFRLSFTSWVSVYSFSYSLSLHLEFLTKKSQTS
jgi:hypothetical protein